MALVVKDRVKDTTTTTGTGTITLANSPPNGYQAFSSLGDGSTTYYAIEDADKTDWEVGIGTYTLSGHTLARTTVLASTNSNNAISLSSGEHTVFCDYPSGKAFLSDEGIDKTFTASGTITAGKPVILKADGKAEQVKETTTTNSTISNSAFVEDSTTYANVITSISYCSTSGYYIKTFNSGSTGYPTYKTGTYNSSTNNIDWGAATTIQSYNLRGNYVICHANSSGAIGLLYTIRDGSTDILKCSTTTLSSGVLQGLTTAVSVVSDSSEEFYPLGIVYDAGQSRFVATWATISGGTYPIYANAFQPDADNAPTWSSSNQITALAGGSSDNLTSGNFHSLIYDPDTQRVVQFYYYMDSGTRKVGGKVLSLSGSTITAGANAVGATAINTSSSNTWSTCYDTQNDKILLAYRATDGKISIYFITVTGGGTNTLSFSTSANITAEQANTQNITFDETNNKMIMFWSSDTSSRLGYISQFTSDGSALTEVGTRSQLSGTNTFDCSLTWSGVWVSGKGTAYSSRTDSATKSLDFTTYFGTTTTTNLDNNYLGVASTSATDGNKVQVNMPDKSINVDQTGLTIGEEYFTDGTGAVRPFYSGGASLTTGEYLGTAVSATDLQLKETPTELIGNSGASITKGDPVVVKTNGDFAKVGSSTSSVSVSYSDGTPSEIQDGWVDYNSVSYDEAQSKFLVVYRDQDNSSYGFCRVVTVSNKTLTVGSETSAFNSNTTTPLDSMYIGDSKHCIVYYDGSSHGKAIIATVSGDSVTFGSAVTWSTTTIHARASAYYDSNAGAVVISGRRGGSSTYYTVALSVSGTTLTAGSVVEDSSYTNTDYYCSAYDVNAQIGVVGFRNTSDDGYLRTISVSGNTVTLNTAMNFNSTNNVVMYKDSLTYDPVSQKCFILYRDLTEAALRGRVVSISGTTVTVGTDAQVLGIDSNNFGCQGTDQGGIVCVCRNSSSPYYLRSRIATISGTSFSMTNSETLTSASVADVPSLAYQPSDYTVLIIYGDSSSHDLQGVCVIPEGTVTSTTYNLTSENYIGIAKSSSSAANKTAIITVDGGVDSNQSELTAGQLYYVQTDGTISTTAGSPSVVAGIGLSATELLVTKS